jgi:uncharacterized metal-binding protein (TIGR02443 family)
MRRFIAGAVCPQCRQIDRIIVEVTADGRRRRCVACGHAEILIESLPPEPATRLTSRARIAAPVQPVRLLEPGARPSPGSAEDASK